MSSPENTEIKKSEKKATKLPTYMKEAVFGIGLSAFSLGVVQQFERGNLGINPPDLYAGHIHDTLASVGISYYSRILHQGNRLINAASGFVIPSAYEIGQRFGLLEGTFDQKDFIAYGIGASIYYAAERIRTRNNSANELPESTITPDL